MPDESLADGKKLIQVYAIDDDELYLRGLKYMLRKISEWEIEFKGFTNSADAFVALANQAPDIIFLDYYLHLELGSEVLRSIREAYGQRPVIVLTGSGDERLAAEMMRNGATDYLSKADLSPELLRMAVEGAMAQYRYHQERLFFQEKLNEARKMEAIGTLAGGLAHDFNNLLTVLIGHLEMASSKFQGQQGENHIVTAHNVCLRMAGLIKRLVTFSQGDLDQLKPLSLRHIINKATVLLEHSITPLIQFNIEFLDDDKLIVEATERGIEEILIQLCTNAAEAITGHGAIVVRAGRVQTETLGDQLPPAVQGQDFVFIEVRDNGKGIAPQHLKRIYDPFFTTKELGTEKGIGLGLTLVWHHVEVFNGIIDMESTVGVGTRVRVFLPRVSDTSRGSGRFSARPGRGTESVLLVGRNQPLLEEVRQRFQEKKYVACLATTREQALQMYADEELKIRCVVVDLSAEREEEAVLVSRMHELNSTIPIIFAHEFTTSADTRGSNQEQRINELISRVRSVLDSAPVS